MEKIILVQEEPRGPSILVEVPVLTNGQGRVTLPDVPQLRNTTDQIIIIKAMRIITADTLSRAPIGGQVAAPLAELQKLSIILYAEGWEKGQNIPLLVLNDVATPAGNIPYRQNPTKFSSWRNVDWNKSYIQYSNGTTGSANTPYSVMFDIEYVKINAAGVEIIGPSS